MEYRLLEYYTVSKKRPFDIILLMGCGADTQVHMPATKSE